MKNQKNILIYVIVISIILGFSISQIAGVEIVNNNLKSLFMHKKIPNSEQGIVNDCMNKGLIDSAYCINKDIKTFYKYNITNDNTVLSFNDLKRRGGDCFNWAQLYKRLGDDLGFNSKMVTLKVSETSSLITEHVITILSNKEGYCVLSNENVWCVSFIKEV